jgi:hypothetical protein
MNKLRKEDRLHWLVLGLLGFWPFVSFLDHNRDDALVYWYGIAVIGIAFVAILYAVAWIGGKWLRRQQSSRITLTLGAGAVCLFNYLTIAEPLSEFGISLGTIKIAIWLALSLAILSLTWRLSARPGASLALCIMAAVMVVVPASRLIVFAIEASNGSSGTEPALPMAAAGTNIDRPNVYWLILDGYPRADVLESYFSYSNQPFLTALVERGFVIAESAYANYASTKLSISTTGTMEYYLPVNDPMHPKLWTARLQGFNPVVDRFMARGYRYIHVEPGGNNGKTRCGGREAQCITSTPSGALGLNEAEVGLLKLTAVFPIVRRLFRGLLTFDFTTLSDVTVRLNVNAEQPLFAFIHILSPHPPPRNHSDCSPVRDVAFDLTGAEPDSTPERFLTDLKCLNPEVLKFVDYLLANDPGDPVILVQSDHGYRGDENDLPAPTSPAIDRRLIRFATLQAMRLPKRCDKMMRPDITLVNTFRVVFSCLGDSDVKPISDNLFVHSKTTTWPLVVD